MGKTKWGFALACALVVSAFTVSTVQAQFPVQVTAGPSFGTISSDDFPDASTSVGFFAALGTSFQINDMFGVNPHVAYVQKGAEWDDGDEVASYDYIEIPVFLSASFPVGETMGFGVSAGPQISFQINCDEDGVDCSEEFDDHESIDYGVVFAAGLSYPFSDTSGIAFGGGADIGFKDIFSSVDYKTRTYYIYVAYQTQVGG